MSAAASGSKGKVLNGTADCDVTGWTADLSTNDTDTTTTADGGWDDATGGTSKIEGSFDYFINVAKLPTKAVGVSGGLGLREGGVIAQLTLMVDDAGDGVGFQGKALITKVSTKSVTKTVITGTASFKGKGVWKVPGDTLD